MDSWKLTPVAQQKIIQLADYQLKVQRLHGLVEQYATARVDAKLMEPPLRRAAEQLKVLFTGAGYGPMAQLAGAMAIALRRGGPVPGKARILREAIGSLRSQIETQQRITSAEGRVRLSPQDQPD
ncbi:MAG: hypothetical protein FIB01_04680 [Gemmatimonadetes bacterium]|nr:hypothetical protein [Gemmatimonadota bacterium]